MDETDLVIEQMLREESPFAIDSEEVRERAQKAWRMFLEMKRQRALVVWVPPGFICDLMPWVQREDGIVAWYYSLSTGYLWRVTKMIHNYRLTVSWYNPHFYNDAWCYDDFGDAVIALFAGCLGREPQGWKRHINSGRRRSYHEDGTLEQEWFQL